MSVVFIHFGWKLIGYYIRATKKKRGSGANDEHTLVDLPHGCRVDRRPSFTNLAK
jgi:hypothetical protein